MLQLARFIEGFYTIIDGKVYFDINNDENDQRLAPNPEAPIPTYMEAEAGHDVDACMEGTHNVMSLFMIKHKH